MSGIDRLIRRRIQTVALTIAVIPAFGEAQHHSPVAEAFRANASSIERNILLAAEAMPPEKYAFRATSRQPSVADILRDVVSSNDYWCAVVPGVAVPNRPKLPDSVTKAILVNRVRESMEFCQSSLAELDDSRLDEPVVRASTRSRALAMTTATAHWADLYSQLTTDLRLNGRVPPTPCAGGEDCHAGWNVCKTVNSAGSGDFLGLRPGGSVTLSDTGYSVTSDGRGAYVNAASNATVIPGANRALFLSAPSPVPGWPVREITVDLNHPVPGDIGVPLGMFAVSANVELGASWYTGDDDVVHRPADIPIGTTVRALQMNVAMLINGVAHTLQMGPQPIGHCFSDGTAIYGDGSTPGTIAHPTAMRWVVDLPAGSIGRLFDIHLRDANAVNRGLYYVSLHFVIER